MCIQVLGNTSNLSIHWTFWATNNRNLFMNFVQNGFNRELGDKWFNRFEEDIEN